MHSLRDMIKKENIFQARVFLSQEQHIYERKKLELLIGTIWQSVETLKHFKKKHSLSYKKNHS